MISENTDNKFESASDVLQRIFKTDSSLGSEL